MKYLPVFSSFILFSSLWIQGLGQAAQDSSHLHDFDFWVGEWVVYAYGTESIVGNSNIESILGGNAIRESYQAAQSGYMGSSINTFNRVTGNWEQYYVDNGGLILHILGERVQDTMTLGNVMEVQGKPVYNQISWYPTSDGSVRQTWRQRPDTLSQWNVVFDGLYKQKP